MTEREKIHSTLTHLIQGLHTYLLTAMVNYEASSFQVQGLASSISKRLSSETNSLLLNAIPTGRQAKRHAQQINYSEDFIDDFEIENSPEIYLTVLKIVGVT